MMYLLELPDDIQDKIFDIRLNDIERQIINLEKKVEDFEIISRIEKNEVIFEYSMNGGFEAVGTAYIENHIHILNYIITIYDVYENLYDIIDTDKKIRIIVNTGKVLYQTPDCINYKDEYDNYYYISPIQYLSRYIDIYIMMIRIHHYLYKNDSGNELDEIRLLKVVNVICLDDLMGEYNFDVINEKDIRYYAIDYII